MASEVSTSTITLTEEQQTNLENRLRPLIELKHKDSKMSSEREPALHKNFFQNKQKIFYNNLRRRSSIEKIMYICNQSYSVFPHVFLWLQDFQNTLSIGFRKMIPLIKSLFLILGVYLGFMLLLTQLMFCLVVAFKLTTPAGLLFLLGCAAVLGLIAFRSFVIIPIPKKTHRSLYDTMKKVQ